MKSKRAPTPNKRIDGLTLRVNKSRVSLYVNRISGKDDTWKAHLCVTRASLRRLAAIVTTPESAALQAVTLHQHQRGVTEPAVIVPPTIFACFEFNAVDAPILKALKSPGPAIAWRDANYFERFIMPFGVDVEPVTFEPTDLFEWAEQNAAQAAHAAESER